MRENIWTNTQTLTELGVNSMIGSPRAWLMRALNVVSTATELDICPGGLHPKLITVAGVWPQGSPLPDTESYHCLYRFFELPDKLGTYYNRGQARQPMKNYTGIACQVPDHEILDMLRKFKAGGAEWTWWAYEGEAVFRNKYKPDERPANGKLDHAEIYRRLDAGESMAAMAREFGVTETAIHYVRRKWARGAPAVQHRAIDPEVREQIIQDIKVGELAFTEIADKYNTTRATVSKWAQRVGASRKKPKNESS